MTRSAGIAQNAAHLRFVLASVAGIGLLHCSTPSASGTKTNWFVECEEDGACGDGLSCLCGVCTLSCVEDAGCEEGVCSTSLESAALCGTTSPDRLCLPVSESECAEAAVAADDNLGEAIPASCAIEGALVCEVFDAPFPAQYSTWFEDEMSAVIQNCEVSSGQGALRYSSSGPGQAQTRIRLPEQIASGALHARFLLKLGPDMILPEQLQFLEFWDREGAAVPERISLFLRPDGALRVYVGASATTVEPSEPAPLPRDQWVCVELAVDLQAQDGAVELMLDGAMVSSESGFASRPTNPVSVVVVEAQPTTDTTGVDVVLDELVVATGPIGCP